MERIVKQTARDARTHCVYSNSRALRASPAAVMINVAVFTLVPCRSRRRSITAA
jgi:hypothetical protein